MDKNPITMEIPHIYKPERKFFSGRSSEILVEDDEVLVVPRNTEAEAGLIKSHNLLQALRGSGSRPPAALPETILGMHPGRNVHVLRYPFIPGHVLQDFLLEASPKRIQAIAGRLGRFLAWLHALPPGIAEDVPLVLGRDKGKSFEVGAYPKAILHNDLQGLNVVVTPTDELGIIDFANACYGDPAADLRKLFGRKSTEGAFAERVLEAYFESSPAIDRNDFKRRLDLHVRAFKAYREKKAAQRKALLMP